MLEAEELLRNGGFGGYSAGEGEIRNGGGLS